MRLFKSKLRGHEIYTKNGHDWFYSDDNTPTAGNPRNCGFFQQANTKDGHDPCIANLPDVQNACCGHGEPEEAYIHFWDGYVIRGFEAITLQSILKL